MHQVETQLSSDIEIISETLETDETHFMSLEIAHKAYHRVEKAIV